MALGGVNLLAIHWVPQDERIAVAYRCQNLAVRRPSNGRRPLAGPNFLGGSRVPEANGLVLASGGQGLAVRRPGHGIDILVILVMQPARPNLLLGRRIP